MMKPGDFARQFLIWIYLSDGNLLMKEPARIDMTLKNPINFEEFVISASTVKRLLPRTYTGIFHVVPVRCKASLQQTV